MAESKCTDTGENPFLADVGLTGLLGNLQNRSTADGPGFAPGKFDPERLQAMAQQAASVKEEALRGLRAIGSLLAIASTTGNVDAGEVHDAGWTINFLTELAESMDLIEANASFQPQHGVEFIACER